MTRVATARAVEAPSIPPHRGSGRMSKEAPSGAAIEVVGLAKSFGVTRALDGVNLSIPPPDLRDFPVAEGVSSDVRTWLLVGEDDPFRQANEALHALLQRQLGACRLTVVPRLGHDLPNDLPDRLHEAVSFALAESQ